MGEWMLYRYFRSQKKVHQFILMNNVKLILNYRLCINIKNNLEHNKNLLAQISLDQALYQTSSRLT